jgi:hypothetical protein
VTDTPTWPTPDTADDDSTTINREAPAAVGQLDRELTLAVGKKVHDESAVL